jgi:hypothetical protein
MSRWFGRSSHHIVFSNSSRKNTCRQPAAAWFVSDIQNRLRKIIAEKAPSKKEFAGENRLHAVGSPHWAQAGNSPAPLAQPPPLVKGLDASHELKLALDFTLGGCADELVRKHVASRKFIIKRGAAERGGGEKKDGKRTKNCPVSDDCPRRQGKNRRGLL